MLIKLKDDFALISAEKGVVYFEDTNHLVNKGQLNDNDVVILF